MADLQFFEPALDQLKANLPAHWSQERVASELANVCQVVAEQVDELAAAIEQVYLDQSLATASDEALRSQWAALYGVSREDQPLDTETLRGYLLARAQEDGSIASMTEALLAVLRNPANDSGTPMMFPNDGSGLTFPSDGSGIGPLFQQDSTERIGLRFPPDGSGLAFPSDGSGLVFPASGRLEVSEAYDAYRLDVVVRTWLAFDRPAFARAVARFRQAHMVVPTITETTS